MRFWLFKGLSPLGTQFLKFLPSFISKASIILSVLRIEMYTIYLCENETWYLVEMSVI